MAKHFSSLWTTLPACSSFGGLEFNRRSAVGNTVGFHAPLPFKTAGVRLRERVRAVCRHAGGWLRYCDLFHAFRVDPSRHPSLIFVQAPFHAAPARDEEKNKAVQSGQFALIDRREKVA